MTNDFQRPFAPPPTIFGIALLAGLGIDFVHPVPMLPILLQLAFGAAVVTAGVLLIRSSMKSIDGGGTTYDPYAASTSLVTSGIYRYSRNPGYFGLAVILFGLALMIDSPWIAVADVAAIMITNLFVIKLEEEKLDRTFGQEYRDYVSQVRRWI